MIYIIKWDHQQEAWLYYHLTSWILTYLDQIYHKSKKTII